MDEKKGFKEVVSENKGKIIGGLVVGLAAVVGLILGAKALGKDDEKEDGYVTLSEPEYRYGDDLEVKTETESEEEV